MAKLSLVIADSDESYLESLVNYLTSNHSHKFQVDCFSKQNFLSDYLNRCKKVDILLVSTDMYSRSIPREKVNTLVVMSTGRIAEEYKECDVINKYQTGYKIYSSIINIFSERNPNEITSLHGGSKSTKVIAVYSPSGGSGKTDIAVSSCIQLGRKGRSVFYLNLETVQSTPIFFKCDSQQNLSQILYYVKQRNKNINLKIEAVRNVDSGLNIHYFSPPESVYDLEEVNSEDIKYLINSLKSMGSYDVVFVDMSSELNSKNITVLDICDDIFFTVGQDDMSYRKLQAALKEFQIISQRNNSVINEKLTFILNKYSPDSSSDIERAIYDTGRDIYVKIPRIMPPSSKHIEKYILRGDGEFSSAVNNLIRKL